MLKATRSVPTESRNVNLFDVPSIPKPRRSNHAECEDLKAKYGIQTHCMADPDAKGGRNWMALSMPAACEKLKGYGLNDEEKTVLSAIVAGYGRLLDECGLLIDSEATEFEAVKKAAAVAGHATAESNPCYIPTPSQAAMDAEVARRRARK